MIAGGRAGGSADSRSQCFEKPLGIYLHIPFCKSKCPYCDFYSVIPKSSELTESYTTALAAQIAGWGQRFSESGQLCEGGQLCESEIASDNAAFGSSAASSPAIIDTVYFGGGTPSLLTASQITRLLDSVNRFFTLKNPEITLEVNPGESGNYSDFIALGDTLRAFSAMGGNRVSIGMQSVSDAQLSLLGRRHTISDVEKTVKLAKSAGIENISLDIMLATEGQTTNDVVESVARAHSLGAKHVSIYLLKIEEGTPFHTRRREMNLPDEDSAAELYLAACNTLAAFGYHQYEISNFAFDGFESRHNLKYWLGESYLGIGPAAHSFSNGKRFYYEDNISNFIQNVENYGFCEPVLDDEDSYIKSGSAEEFIMLRMRLSKGVSEADFYEHFGKPIPASVREKSAKIPAELIISDDTGIRLSTKGFLLSNYVISLLIG